MAKVIKFPTGTTLSIRSFAEEARKDRETIANRVRAAQVPSAGKRGGFDVYRLRDLIDAAFLRDESGRVDPERLQPFERHAHYKAEYEKLRLQTGRAEVVPRIEVEQEMARLAKIVAQFFDTLPDRLERDTGMTPLVVAKVERYLDEVREELYKAAIGEDAEVVNADRALL